MCGFERVPDGGGKGLKYLRKGSEWEGKRRELAEKREWRGD